MIKSIMYNKCELGKLNNKKIDYLLDKVITKFVFAKETDNSKFASITLDHKLTLNQCCKIIDLFPIGSESLLFADLFKNPTISIKTKEKLFKNYNKRQVFK